jgi:hypothetical protein
LDLDKFNEYDQQYKMVMIGRAISKSAHLRELSIQGHRHGLKSFFTWIVRNRSIEHLTIDQIDLSDEDVDIFNHRPIHRTQRESPLH